MCAPSGDGGVVNRMDGSPSAESIRATPPDSGAVEAALDAPLSGDAANTGENARLDELCDPGRRKRNGWTFLVDGLGIAEVRVPNIALTASDRVVLAWTEPEMRVAQQAADGCLFEELGLTRRVRGLALGSDSRGNVFRAVVEFSPDELRVERWSDDRWMLFGPTVPMIPPASRMGVELRFDSSGRAVVAWLSGATAQVARWTADKVERLTEPAGVLGEIVWPDMHHPLSLALGPDGAPFVGFRKGNGAALVARLAGAQWEMVGGLLPEAPPDFSEYLSAPVVQVAPGGELYVAWTGRVLAGNPYRGFVSRWTGSGWVPLGAPLISADAPLSTRDIWMALDTRARPVVAATQTIRAGLSRIYLYAWDGNAWQTPAQAIDAYEVEREPVWPRVVVDTKGRWVVSWFQQGRLGSAYTYVTRFTP